MHHPFTTNIDGDRWGQFLKAVKDEQEFSLLCGPWRHVWTEIAEENWRFGMTVTQAIEAIEIHEHLRDPEDHT